MGQYYRYPTFSATATNPSVGPTGASAPAQATEIAGVNAGNLVAVAVSPSGAILTSVGSSSGAITQAALTVGTTAVRLTVSGAAPNANRKLLVFTPDINSVANFYFGSSTVTTASGSPILPGTPGILTGDASDFYIISDTAAQTVNVLEEV